jgi:hypothetical protein
MRLGGVNEPLAVFFTNSAEVKAVLASKSKQTVRLWGCDWISVCWERMVGRWGNMEVMLKELLPCSAATVGIATIRTHVQTFCDPYDVFRQTYRLISEGLLIVRAVIMELSTTEIGTIHNN